MKAFHDPSTPVGICGCGTIISPLETKCIDCMCNSAEPWDLDPIVIALIIIWTIGIGIFFPLVWNLYNIWRG